MLNLFRSETVKFIRISLTKISWLIQIEEIIKLSLTVVSKMSKVTMLNLLVKVLIIELLMGTKTGYEIVVLLTWQRYGPANFEMAVHFWVSKSVKDVLRYGTTIFSGSNLRSGIGH
jgi:hypothetical protein